MKAGYNMGNNLTVIDKKIIVSRLMDKSILMEDAYEYVNYLLIDTNEYKDYNIMYDFIVANYGILIIE